MRHDPDGGFQVPETKEELDAKIADMRTVAEIVKRWGLIKVWRNDAADMNLWFQQQPDKVELDRLKDMSRYRNEDGSLRQEGWHE